MDHSPLLADLATDLPQAVRLQRLADHLRTRFHCGAVALLQLEEGHLRPLAVEGLVREALGRRFAVSQHPRLAAILARLVVLPLAVQLPAAMARPLACIRRKVVLLATVLPVVRAFRLAARRPRSPTRCSSWALAAAV